MTARNIIVGQKVNPEKKTMAKALRQRMTKEEALVWEQVRDHQIEGLRFRRQQIIDGYIVDFYCHQAALVIEIDGEIHDETYIADRERSAVLVQRGLRIIRFQNFEVRNDLAGVVY